MARPKIHPSILADRGVPLRLLGDLDVQVCFSFRAIMLLEERFGSVLQALQVLNTLGEEGSKATTSIARLLSCGLTHEVGPDGEDLSRPENLDLYLDLADLHLYNAVVGRALDLAFPAKAQPGDGQEQEAEGGDPTMAPSPGGSGTGGDESTSVSLPTSSGEPHLQGSTP